MIDMNFDIALPEMKGNFRRTTQIMEISSDVGFLFLQAKKIYQTAGDHESVKTLNELNVCFDTEKLKIYLNYERKTRIRMRGGNLQLGLGELPKRFMGLLVLYMSFKIKIKPKPKP